MDNGSNTTDQVSLFAFGQNTTAKKAGAESKMENRRKNFLNEADSEDLKRKRDDKIVSLRQDKKKAMLNKRRNFGTQGTNANEEAKAKDKTYCIEEAEEAWHDGMDIMEYFKILAQTEFELPHFIHLIQLICDKEDHKILFGVVGLRKLLSLIDNPPIQNVIDANLLPHLLSLIGRADFPRLQFEVLWCLTNIASGKADHVQALIDKGAIPIFITMLVSEHQNIVEQSIWALGNIAGEDVYFKNLILKEGALKPLVTILNHAEKDSMLARNCAWCCTNLLRGKPLPCMDDLATAIPVYCNAIKQNTRKEILTDAMWGISYMSDAGEKVMSIILEQNCWEAIVSLLNHKHNNIALPAIRALGNFVTGEDTETQAVMDAGALPPLHILLNHEDAAIRKEACWTLSNICAGTVVQVAAVIDAGILDSLIELVDHDVYEIQREAGWSVSNATALRNKEIIGAVVEKKGVEAMVKVLGQKWDPKTAVVLLEGLRNVLSCGKEHYLDEYGENPFTYLVEECGGLDIIESMQQHSNQHVYDLAIKILENFFQLEEVDLNENDEGFNMNIEF